MQREFTIIKTYVVKVKDMEEAKELAKTVKDYRILEIYREEDGTEH